ncbi:DEAD/DEAH box helicase [Conexibacter sp. DBS9H8]|uniref:DEAD/DEAH box helicase n=1 Tax=Conexibacter sp. DBS9H8 TaxID=2937801 RepID=UPI00201078C8|nr:DEAD/DEAH box helicase [Conexibacter sp. DBS9H8]
MAARSPSTPPPVPSTTGRDGEPWAALLAGAQEDGRLVAEDVDPARPGQLEPLPPELDPRLVQALAGRGIGALYRHQLEAFASAFTQTTIVTTATASGKSLAFQLPTLQLLLEDRKARALFLYPTKALAQDQARALHSFGLGHALRPAIYDGDTPRQERPAIRRQANVVITNPDMLHVGILPHHGAWGDFLANLAVVVVDEAHVYRGVFGSHVANVLRRLRRLCEHYGTTPRFLLTSATIANPRRHAHALTGLNDIALIDTDGAPRQPRRVVVWNPPLLDAELGSRASPLAEAAELLAGLVAEGTRTICFMKSRKGVELILRMAADRLRARSDLPAGIADRIAPYRAGYTPQQRHEIEARLVNGELLGVVATDALELGIDIGELDAAIVTTFPGTIASLRQMWGRAGRRGLGLAVYVAGEDALDQFFARHPDTFRQRPVEAAIIDPHNPEIFAAHLLCAAHEAPVTEADATILGPDTAAAAEGLSLAGFLRERVTGWVPARADDYPAGRTALRSASADSFLLLDAASGEVLGQIEAARAYNTVHDGAIYLHLGRSYLVRELDLQARRAVLEPFSGEYYTQAKRESNIFIEMLTERRDTHGVTLSYGNVVYSETVLGFQRKHLQSEGVLGFVGLDLPTTEFRTRALWFELDALIAAEPFPAAKLLGSLHALEHGQIAVLPLIAMCDRWDIGGLSTNAHGQTGGPTIFIYDGHPGGIGISKRGFDRFDELVGDAAALIGECPCRSGCPSCVQSPKCGNLNDPLAKDGALELLARMQAHS